MRRSRRLALCWSLMSATVVASATEADPSSGSRPLVGLVLSGGGARGIAHVGVLRVLEEVGVPVDRIAGTSMGAIAGGLYAAGMSPEEMEATLGAVDWQELFSDRPPRRRMTFRAKQDDLTFLAPFELGFRDGRVVLPSGLLAGQKLSFLLRSLTLPVVDVRRFDELPIPFRAVATDIISTEMVVLSEGNLAEAIRASLSVPGVFAPVELDGRLLVDGGLVRNLPVDIVREMGAEVVICADVGEPLHSREELDSLVGLTGQMASMLTRGNVEPLLPLCDVVITPDLEGFTGSDFARFPELVVRGVAAARERLAELRGLALPEPEHRALRERQQPAPIEEIEITSVQVATDAAIDPRQVLRRIRTRPHQLLDLATLERDLTRIYELGYFQLVDFRLVETETGHSLIIDAQEKPWGPNYMRLGVNLTADLEGESAFNLLGSFTMTRLNRLGAEWKTQIQLGETPRLYTEFYQPLDYLGNWFVSPFAESSSQVADIFDDAGNSLGEYRIKIDQGGLLLGRQFGRLGVLGVGMLGGAGHATPRAGPPEWAAIEVKRGGPFAQVVIDQLDNASFPRDGWFAVVDAYFSREWAGADEEYDRVEASASGWRSFGRSTVALNLRAFSGLDSTLPFHHRFALGGLFSLSGYAPGEINGQHGGLVSLYYYRELARLGRGLGGGVYAGFSLEAGNLWEDRGDASWSGARTSGALLLGAETLIGPVYLAYGRGAGSREAYYLYVGRTF